MTTGLTERTGKLYVFEGMDGVGKSTVAQKFADELDGFYMESPGPGIREIRNYVDSENHSKQTQFLMYLASNSALSDQIEPHLEAGNDVILDRYYPTTVVYNEVNEDENKGKWFDIVQEFEFTEPDQMFYLWADPETRIERKAGREQKQSEGKDADEIGASELSKQYNKAIEEFDMTPIEALDGVENVLDVLLSEVDQENE